MSEDYYKALIKDIIENNSKEKAIKIIANKLNEKQISNEKEILTNLEKDKEVERLKEELEKEKYLVDKYTRQLTDEYKNTEYQCKEKERLNNIIKEALILTENTRFEEQYAFDEILLPILNKLRESGIRNYIKVEGSD